MRKLKALFVAAPVALASGSAFATGESQSAVDQIMGAVDVSMYAGVIATVGVAIIGIAAATKAITVGKRLLGKA